MVGYNVSFFLSKFVDRTQSRYIDMTVSHGSTMSVKHTIYRWLFNFRDQDMIFVGVLRPSEDLKLSHNINCKIYVVRLPSYNLRYWGVEFDVEDKNTFFKTTIWFDKYSTALKPSDLLNEEARLSHLKQIQLRGPTNVPIVTPRLEPILIESRTTWENDKDESYEDAQAWVDEVLSGEGGREVNSLMEDIELDIVNLETYTEEVQIKLNEQEILNSFTNDQLEELAKILPVEKSDMDLWLEDINDVEFTSFVQYLNESGH